MEFLKYLFKKHDKNNDGCLNQTELTDMFSCCPIATPWGKDVLNTIETNTEGEITFYGFISEWV